VRDIHLKNSLFNVRLAQIKDAASLADILTTSFYCDDKGKFVRLKQWLQPLIRWGISLDLNHRLNDDSPRYACLVADRLERPVRAIATLEIGMRYIPQTGRSISLLDWQASQFPYLFNLAVHPQWRRQGAAIQLLSSAEQMAARWGFQQLYLHVLENNLPARQLYQEFGYQFYKVEPGLRFWLGSNPRRLLLRKVIN
jgi:ribosomal protein S18 acetylase RimI-like enzyme